MHGWAAYLLARLPGSALGQRMAERALGCLRLDRDIGGTRLVASPPAECDADMRRDGITPRPGAGRSQLADQAHLLLEVMARTPLRTWTGEFGRSAEQILAVPAGGWAPVLFTGWSRAAMAQRDQEWMAALINWAIAGGPPGHPPGPRRCGSWSGEPIRPWARPGSCPIRSRARRRPSTTRSGCCAFATTC